MYLVTDTSSLIEHFLFFSSIILTNFKVARCIASLLMVACRHFRFGRGQTRQRLLYSRRQQTVFHIWTKFWWIGRWRHTAWRIVCKIPNNNIQQKWSSSGHNNLLPSVRNWWTTWHIASLYHCRKRIFPVNVSPSGTNRIYFIQRRIWQSSRNYLCRKPADTGILEPHRDPAAVLRWSREGVFQCCSWGGQRWDGRYSTSSGRYPDHRYCNNAYDNQKCSFC